MESLHDLIREIDGVTIVDLGRSPDLGRALGVPQPVFEEWEVVPVLAELGDHVRARPGIRLVLDLSGVASLTSLGVGQLVAIRRKCLAVGGTLKLCGLQPVVQELFSATRLEEVFEVHPDVVEAVAAFRKEPPCGAPASRR